MDPLQVTYGVTRCYLQDRKSTLPVSVYETLSGWIRSRSHQKLAACVTSFTHDVTGVEAMRTLYQVESLFKKNRAFTEPVSARLAALLSFEEGEAICEETNRRLDACHVAGYENSEMARYLPKMARWIDKVLGDHNDFLRELPKLIQVTSGATATRARRRALPFLKVSKRVVCTPGAFPYISTLAQYFGYGEMGGRLLSENRVAFVPKSWKTERTIACEAEGNMALQLAFDAYAKTRLRRIGIDLSDQTRNQELAKEGSIRDNFATIDLSMASDTLSYNVVAAVLPDSWFNYLRAIRSQYYTLYPFHRQAYHKFSSMGNGGTFALETLVFAAACRAVGSVAFVVYGDDIVIEQHLASELMALLAFLGFVPNTDKSFLSGPFRESCGKFWYKGFDITPVYIRELDSRKATWCHLVNSLMTICRPCGQLSDYLVSIVLDKRLPLAPYNESTIGGVWIDPHSAYERKLIRISKKGRKAWIPRCRLYQSQLRTQTDLSMRSLFLWHLDAARRGTAPIREPIIRSRSSTSSHKFVRKWVHWKPVVGAPDHIYLWSEELFLRLDNPD